MRWLRQLFTIQTVATPGLSAAAYVPWVMVSRGLAFLRTLLVARLVSQYAFGLYQPALELINPLAALVMFGAADVAERYVSRVEHEAGRAGVRRWLWRQWRRVAVTGILVAATMIALSPWISAALWRLPHTYLLGACALAIAALALYQHLAATLRGLRAYGAAAGMEFTGAALLLLFSTAAALLNDALWLVLAYFASVLLPLVAYGWALELHLRRAPDDPAAANSVPLVSDTLLPCAPRPPPAFTPFATWTMLRLLLVLLFGFLSIWGVTALELHREIMLDNDSWAPVRTAQYAMPYRIAQLLGFVAVTAWASMYGIAARAWSHGQIRRAKAQYFRVGRHGMAALTLLAVALLLARGTLVWLLPSYAHAIEDLLPRLLAIFLGYALLSFYTSWADLHETPWKGVLLWAIVVALLASGIALGSWRAQRLLWPFENYLTQGTTDWMLAWSAAGMAAALCACLALFCRSRKIPATGMPILALTAAAAALFAPAGLVNWIAPPLMLGTVLALYLTGYLIRPYDRRAFNNWYRHR